MSFLEHIYCQTSPTDLSISTFVLVRVAPCLVWKIACLKAAPLIALVYSDFLCFWFFILVFGFLVSFFFFFFFNSVLLLVQEQANFRRENQSRYILELQFLILYPSEYSIEEINFSTFLLISSFTSLLSLSAVNCKLRKDRVRGSNTITRVQIHRPST